MYIIRFIQYKESKPKEVYVNEEDIISIISFFNQNVFQYKVGKFQQLFCAKDFGFGDSIKWVQNFWFENENTR